MVWAGNVYRNDRHLAELTGQVVRSGRHSQYFIRSRSRLLLHGLGRECLQERPSLGRVDGAGSEVGTTLSILHTIARLLLHGLGRECLQKRPSLGRVDGAGSEVGTTLSILHTIAFSAALVWSGPGMSTGTTVTWPS